MFRASSSIEDAIDEIATWADSLPGDFAVDVTEHDDLTIIDVAGALVSSGLRLQATLLVDAQVSVAEYRFDLRHPDGRLLWRQDRHPGHERAPGMRGPEHVHLVEKAGEVREPADPVELSSLREQLVQANLDHAR